jgi:SAM-dependent methyltransferase
MRGDPSVSDVHEQLRRFWDADAPTYDRSASHAGTDLVEAAAWRAILRRHLPPAPSRVLDAGAGTGTMSLLVASLGHRVTALDLSPGMLERAGEKARAAGVPLETVVAPVTEPPPGPFDAMIERHVLWTAPDPEAALEAWRRVAPGGRLVVFEGIWNREDALWHLRRRAARTLRPVLGVEHDHHAGYDPDLLASLPLARATSPEPLLGAVSAAGWRNVSIERLRDVEWARRIAAPWPLGWLETVPQFAVVADA